MSDAIGAEFRGLKIPIRSVISQPLVDLMESSAYERPEIEAALSIVKPGDRVLEIGAGLGLASAAIVQASQPEAILSVEANPNLIERIGELHRLNGLTNIEVRSGAVRAGPNLPPTTSFFLHQKFMSSSLLRTRNRKARGIEVPTIDFDALVKEFRPDVLIMDIEGGEDEIIRNGDLSTLRKLSFELHPQLYGFMTAFGIERRLRRAGFRKVKAHSSRMMYTGQRT